MWTDEQLRILIDNCKEYNENYHELVGNGKRIFWKRVSTKINLKFGTSYSDAHCKEKFEGLKCDYKRMKAYIDGKDNEKKTKNGLKYYEEFKSEFWEKPTTEYDQLCEQNIARRYQTPPLSYEENEGSTSQPQPQQ